MAADISGYRQGISIKLSQSALAIEFIATFMRFEFALKHGGFLKGEPGCRADVGWNCFAQRLGVEFFQVVRTAPEADILFSTPPKRLVVAEKRTPIFVPVDPSKNAQGLLAAVRCVRNNLFHGEKPDLDARDISLIAASLFVLDRAIAACETTAGCEQVANAFAYAPVNGV